MDVDQIPEARAVPPSAHFSDSKGRAGRLTFLDINTFYSRRAGGIRAFYDAKIAYFRRSLGTRYILVCPGPRFSWTDKEQNVSVAKIYGPVVSRDPSGYRFMIDYVAVHRVIRRSRPDVIEVGDPWLSGLFCILLKKLGLYSGLLVSYFHSDPILTHLLPWASRGRFQGLRKSIVLKPLAALFYGVQRTYDLTVVSSRVMQKRLVDMGVAAVVLPLGVPSSYLDAPLATRSASADVDGIKLLFVGRLNLEKGIELIRDIVPRLLKLDHVYVTVIGRGGAQDFFGGLKHPRFQYKGFVEDPLEVRDIYDEHDILLAPGPFESFGLAVVEAMARGLVVVGPDTGGTGELLRDVSSNFIFKASDPEDFLRVVMRAINYDRTKEITIARDFALKQGSIDAAMKRIADHYVMHLDRRMAESSS